MGVFKGISRKLRWFIRHKVLRRPVPQWHEVPLDAVNKVGTCVGIVYSGNPWSGSGRVSFDGENYGVIEVNTHKREE